MAKEEKFGSKIKFAKFNTKTSEAHSHLAGTLGIQALPTFFVYVKGKKATQLAGADVRKLRNLAACYI